MNKVFHTQNNSVVQIRIIDKSTERRVGFSIYQKLASWGTGFEIDFSMFGYHLLTITFCQHCMCNEKGKCKHSVKRNTSTKI